MSVRVRRIRLIVGTCSPRSGKCRDVFGEVGLGSGRVRRGRFCVGTCSAWSVCVGRVLRSRISVVTCPARSFNVGP